MGDESDDFSMNDLSGRATFHGGLPKQWRLHELWTDANNYSRSGNFVLWKRVLDVVTREMMFIMTEKEKQSVKKLVTGSVLPALKKLMGGSFNNRTLVGADEAYTVLSEYDSLLREISGAHQLDMPGSADPSQAFKHGRS